VFNGEIYNYLELREQLRKEGVVFRTDTDTEVLIESIVHWGSAAVNRFNGMWGFVWVDMQNGEVLVSRDRWGVKPLYWLSDGDSMVICSEAKGIVKYLGTTPPPNHTAIGMYCKHGVAGQFENSWFEGIRRFPLASNRRFRAKAGTMAWEEPERYWNYPTTRTITDPAEAGGRLQELLVDAIRLRLRSDVPLGLSLSGGVDSSCIAWLVRERFDKTVDAFTAWHEPRDSSELPIAQRIAKQFGHESYAVPEPPDGQVINVLRDAVYHLDGGHGSTIVPYLNLCRAARSKITVSLEGQGADELLAGYVTFALYSSVDNLQRLRFREFMNDASAFAHARGWPKYLMELLRHSSQLLYQRHARWTRGRGILASTLLDAQGPGLCPIRPGTDNLSRALEESHRGNLTYLLQYSDALAMSVGLESRCPFLDYRLVELAFSMDTALLFRKGFGKSILRRVMSHAVDAEVVWKRKKEGFTNRTEQLVRREVATHGLPVKGLALAEGMGLFVPGRLNEQSVKHLTDTTLFRLVSVLLWLELFYDPDN
jgi:asparagine synthase (glutamine-hydrolysing)